MAKKPKMKWDRGAVLRGFEIIEMSPMKFLSQVPSPCAIPGHNAAMDIDVKDCFSKSSVKHITEQVEEGVTFDPPMLDFERMFMGYPSHEGRHTSFVALKRGEKKIPVMVAKARARYT